MFRRFKNIRLPYGNVLLIPVFLSFFITPSALLFRFCLLMWVVWILKPKNLSPLPVFTRLKIEKHVVPIVSLCGFRSYKTKHSHEKILPNMLIIDS